jgi:hypothetical protein
MKIEKSLEIIKSGALQGSDATSFLTSPKSSKMMLNFNKLKM